AQEAGHRHLRRGHRRCPEHALPVHRAVEGMGPLSEEARANRLFLPGFAACVWLAWRRRGQADWHKRLLLVGTLFMLGPVLSRAYDALVVAWMEPLFRAFVASADEVLFLVYFFGAW